MFNWIDVVIAIILIYNLFKGFTKGFVRSITGIVGYIVSGLVAKVYYKSTAIYIVKEYRWFGEIKNSISNLPTNIKGDMVDFFWEFRSTNTSGNANDIFSEYFSDYIMNGIAYLLIFFTCLALIKFLSIILNSFVNLPILKQVNQLSGIIFGGVKGCLIVYLIMTVVVFTTPVISNTIVMESIKISNLGSFFYNYNIFLFIIDNIAAGDFKNLIFTS